MTDVAPLQHHADNEAVTENGHTGRFILPCNPTGPVRRNSASTRFLAGRAPLREFTLRPGDCSTLDRRDYAANLAYAPQRAMLTYEHDGRRELAPGQGVFLETLVNLLPSPLAQLITAKGKVPWWEVLMQWNVAPLLAKGAKRWRSPIAAVGLATVDGVECMTFECRKEPPARGDQGEIAFHVAVPIKRRQYRVRVEFVDGRGGLGRFRAWLDGKLVADYEGPVGYLDFGPPYAAYGYYRAPNAQEVRTIRFEGFTEGLLAA